MENNAQEFLTIANELEAFILNTIVEATTVSKYGGTLFTVKPDEKEGQFCGVFIYSKHVQLSFSLGAQLTDPKNKLCGGGKFRRHINFKTTEEIDYPYLEKLVCEASKL